MYSYELFESLQGPRISLTRLNESEIKELAQRLYSPTTWAVRVRNLNDDEKLNSYFRNFLEKDRKNESLSLMVKLNSTQEIVGFSRFHSALPDFSRIEIGFTWISDLWMRTFVNTETKYLMLRYAFEVIGSKRVEFVVDPTNEKSNRAMKRIGATYEGTLRKWRALGNQDRGDRNIYSIIDDEWPTLKIWFEEKIALKEETHRKEVRD